jgi:hypothetical protein
MLIIDIDEGLKIVLYVLVIIGRLWVPGTIDSGRKGHDLSPLRISCRHNGRTIVLFVKKNLNCGYFDLKTSTFTVLR